MRTVEESQVGLKLNGIYHLLALVNDMNLLENNRNAVRKNT
jgi:hypothetical protein